MIRKELHDIGVGKVNTFTGIYCKTGKRYKMSGITFVDCLVKLVVNDETSQLITDHCWISKISLKQVRELKKGDIVSVTSKIVDYNGDHTGLKGGKVEKIK